MITTIVIHPTDVAELWRQQYQGGNGTWGHLHIGDAELIYQQLLTATTEEAVDQIIGHAGWTTTPCDECHAAAVTLVRMGDEPDYESNTVTVWSAVCAAVCGVHPRVARSRVPRTGARAMSDQPSQRAMAARHIVHALHEQRAGQVARYQCAQTQPRDIVLMAPIPREYALIEAILAVYEDTLAGGQTELALAGDAPAAEPHA